MKFHLALLAALLLILPACRARGGCAPRCCPPAPWANDGVGPGTMGPGVVPPPIASPEAAPLLALEVPEKVRARLTAVTIEAIETPDRMEVFAVESDTWRDAGREHGGLGIQKHALDWLTRRHGVLSSLESTRTGNARWDRRFFRDVASRLFEGIAKAQESAECYSPRHAIRFDKGDHVVVVILCFECTAIAVLEPTTTVWNVWPFLDPDHALRNDLNARFDKTGAKREQAPPDPEPDDFEEDDDEDWGEDDEDDEDESS